MTASRRSDVLTGQSASSSNGSGCGIWPQVSSPRLAISRPVFSLPCGGARWERVDLHQGAIGSNDQHDEPDQGEDATKRGNGDKNACHGLVAPGECHGSEETRCAAEDRAKDRHGDAANEDPGGRFELHDSPN